MMTIGVADAPNMTDNQQTPSTGHLAGLINAMHLQEGATPSAINGVDLIRVSKPTGRTPLMYTPSMVIVAQGQKIGHLGTQQFIYNSGNYLVQTLPLPFECETQASATEPLLGLSIRLDLAELQAMANKMDYQLPGNEEELSPMAAVKMSPEMEVATIRLINTLNDPLESRILGDARRQEVMFQLLRGNFGPHLIRLLSENRPFSRIVRAINRLQEHYAEPVNVADLANSVDMSISSFHQHFKTITHTSPLQYQKQIRLLKSQQLISSGTVNITQAARDVGYDSNSQFSREYKRYFGHTPREELKHNLT